MFLLPLLACSGSETVVTDQPPRFDGYHVDICVVTHDSFSAYDDPRITVSQIAGFDAMTASREFSLVHDGSMQEFHYCAKDVTLYAEHGGQAISTRVFATRNAFKIEKVEVSYPLAPAVVFLTLNVRTIEDGKRGVIEAKEMDTGWWWFNVIGTSDHDGIPTAVIDTSR